MADAIAPPPVPPRVPLRRPRLVWVIFLFHAISGGAGLIVQLEMLLGLVKLPPGQQALVESMSTAAQLFGFVTGVLGIVAATALWLLRKVALPLFSLSFLLTLGGTAWQFLPGGTYSRMSAQGPLMLEVTVFTAGVGLLVAAGIWAYTFHLWRRGLLR